MILDRHSPALIGYRAKDFLLQRERERGVREVCEMRVCLCEISMATKGGKRKVAVESYMQVEAFLSSEKVIREQSPNLGPRLNLEILWAQGTDLLLSFFFILVSFFMCYIFCFGLIATLVKLRSLPI